MVSGVAMLVGSVAGGVIAQATNLGVPFLLRVGVLLVMFAVAFALMRDVGFTPERSAHPLRATRAVLSASIENGLKNPPVRYVMLAAPFTAGVGIYVFYALQPYLLELFGDPRAYSVAGLAAALVAGAQVLGGWLAPRIRRLVRKRTTVLILSSIVSAVILVVARDSPGCSGWPWCCWRSGPWSPRRARPVRQAYLNDMIASKQRATVLSFDSLMGSSGGVVVQPAARPGGRRLRLPCLAGDRRRDRVDRRAVPAREPPAAPPVRPGQRPDQHHRGGVVVDPDDASASAPTPVSVSCEAMVPTAGWSPEERCRSSAV